MRSKLLEIGLLMLVFAGFCVLMDRRIQGVHHRINALVSTLADLQER